MFGDLNNYCIFAYIKQRDTIMIIEILQVINDLDLGFTVENDTLSVTIANEDLLYFELSAIAKDSDIRKEILDRIDYELNNDNSREINEKLIELQTAINNI